MTEQQRNSNLASHDYRAKDLHNFDAVSVASSRPGAGNQTSGFVAGDGTRVRKVQSSAFVQSNGPTEARLQANKFGKQQINQNSGQLQYQPRVHGSSGPSGGNSFQLSKEAYQKLTSNYNYSKLDSANRKNQIAYATQDLRFQNSAMQQKFDEVCSAIGSNAAGHRNPATIQLKTSNQIRPNTGAGMVMSTQQSSLGLNRRTNSVKRTSTRNTLQAHLTMDSAFTANQQGDPRLQMYNKDMIKNHLEKRRVRRAQSTVRPRQRFSTISAFHKNDIQTISHQPDEGIKPTNNLKQHQNATAYWSANVTLDLEKSGKKTRSYPISGFGGPAYSIPAQHYPGRVSPDKTDRDRTPRTPVDAARGAASSKSPMREVNSTRNISPLSIDGDLTPGCTDYTPRAEQLLKQEPQYAVQRAQRFFQHKEKEAFSNRPHVYEDPDQRTFRRSNSGTFTKAKRFSTPVDGSQVRAYLLSLKNRTTSHRQHSMGNLYSASSKGQKFLMTTGNVGKFESANLNVQDARSKTRPQTEQGRMRARRATEPVTTTEINAEPADQTSTIDQSNKKNRDARSTTYRLNASSMHTPRFSTHHRTGKSVASLEQSEALSTPGPACYETRVDSCLKQPAKQMTFSTAQRWVIRKPTVNPEAPFYDTRPSTYLLHKKQPRVKIAEAKREISPHLFHAKNSTAFSKGVFLKP